MILYLHNQAFHRILKCESNALPVRVTAKVQIVLFVCEETELFSCVLFVQHSVCPIFIILMFMAEKSRLT